MNSRAFLIASIVLGIVVLSPVTAAELPTTANDEFITIFLHGFDKGLQKPALSEEYFVSDRILREEQGWSNAFEYTLYGGEALPFEGQTSGLRELDILEYPSDGFLQEIGDFNTGSRGTEFLDANSIERNQSRQPWLGLARAEWVYRQHPLEFLDNEIQSLLSRGPRFQDLLVDPTTYPDYLKGKLEKANVEDVVDYEAFAQELHEIAKRAPNRFRFVVHSMGGQKIMRFLTEPEDSEFGFYQRNAHYSRQDFREDLGFAENDVGEIDPDGDPAATGRYGPIANAVGDPDVLYEIFKAERENVIEKVITIDSPLSGSHLAQFWSNIRNDPLLGSDDGIDDFVDALVLSAVANMVIANFQLAAGFAMLPFNPTGGLALIAFATLQFTLDLIVIASSQDMPELYEAHQSTIEGSFDPAWALFPELKHLSDGGTLAGRYHRAPPPRQYPGGPLVQFDTLSFGGIPTPKRALGLGGPIGSYWQLAQFATGIIHPSVLNSIFSEAALPLALQLLVGIANGENTIALAEWALPVLFDVLTIQDESGSVVMTAKNSSGEEVGSLSSNPAVTMYRIDTTTANYGRLSKTLEESGVPVADRDWGPFVIDPTGTVLTEWLSVHDWNRDFMTQQILLMRPRVVSFGDTTQWEFYLKGAGPNASALTRYLSVTNDVTVGPLPIDITPTESAAETHFYNYLMFGFEANPDLPLNLGVRARESRFGNEIESSASPGRSSTRSINGLRLSQRPVDPQAASTLTRVTRETLNDVVVNNYVHVLPISIVGLFPRLETAVSVNGRPFIDATRFDEVFGFDTLEEYGDYVAEFEQPTTALVYDQDGQALLVAPRFKEGFNNVTLRFRDGFGGEIYKDMQVLQVTVPPFVKPISPLMNQYVGPSTTTGSVEALDISGGAIKPADWFKDAVFAVRVNGNPVPVTRDMENFRLNFPLTGLPDGNHTIEIHSQVYGLESTTGWRFWLDSTAPEVVLPQIMRFSNRAEDNLGGVQAEIRDVVPYQFVGVDYEVDTVELSSLDFSIEQYGSVVQTLSSDTGTRLGVFAYPWNAWVNDRPLAHGIYDLVVDAEDRVGNSTTARSSVIVDTLPPTFESISLNTTLINTSSGLLELAYRLGVDAWETTGELDVELENTGTGEVFTLETNGGAGVDSVYTMAHFTGGVDVLRDGVYNIRVTASDDLGNSGNPIRFDGIVVDRTRPRIKDAFAVPFELEPSQRTVTLSFRASETNDSPVTVSSVLDTEIELLDLDGNAVSGFAPVGRTVLPESVFEESFELPDTLRDGKYFFSISVTDRHGNTTIDQTAFIRSGVPPEITYPQHRDLVRGTVALYGNIVDPRFGNSLPFSRYELYYRSGDHGVPSDLADLSDWANAAIAVPSYQKQAGRPDNYGYFPVGGGSVVGYLDAGSIDDGLLTILAVSVEEGGYRIASTRNVRVLNTGDTPAVYVDIEDDYQGGGPFPFSFGGGDDLILEYEVTHAIDNPVDVITYVKDAAGNVVQRTSHYSLQSRNVIGRPSDMSETGVYVYQGTDELFYIHLINAGPESAQFLLSLEAIGGFTDVTDEFGNAVDPPPGFDLERSQSVVVLSLASGESWAIGLGIEEESSLTITPTLDSMPSNIFVGGDRFADSSSSVSLRNGSDYPPLVWSGHDVLGRFVTNGAYTVGVEAFGESGGRNSAETLFDVQTPFLLDVVMIDNREIELTADTLSISTATIELNKPGTIAAVVVDENGSVVRTLTPEPAWLDAPGRVIFSWNGADEDNRLVPPASYSYRVIATTNDGSDPIQTDSTSHPQLSGISVQLGPSVNPDIDAELMMQSDESWNGVPVFEGDSSYRTVVTPIGQYLPDRSLSAVISAQGTQVVDAYPDLNFMVALQRRYLELWGQAELTTVELRIAYGNRRNREYRTHTFSVSGSVSGTVVRFDPESGSFTRESPSGRVTVDESVDVPTWVGFKRLRYAEVRSVNHAATIGRPAYVSDSNASWAWNTNYLGFGLNTTVNVDIDVDLQVRPNYAFSLQDYLALADYTRVYGPDIAIDTPDTIPVDFANAADPVAIIEDDERLRLLQGSDRNANRWLVNPTVSFFYVGEDYESRGTEAEPAESVDGAFRFSPIEGDDPAGIAGVSRQRLVSTPQELVSSKEWFFSPADAKVDFRLRRNVRLGLPQAVGPIGLSEFYEVIVTSRAYDRIAYPFPATRSEFSLPHMIGDAEFGIPATRINGERDNTQSIANFEIPEFDLDTGEVRNVFFQEDGDNTVAHDIFLSWDPADGYHGMLLLSALNQSGVSTFPQSASVKQWQVESVYHEGSNIFVNGIQGATIENSVDEVGIPIVDANIAQVRDALWTLDRDPTVVDNTLRGEPRLPDLEWLNRYGFLAEQRISDLYPFPVGPEMGPLGMFHSTSDGGRADNPDVVIAEGLRDYSGAGAVSGYMIDVLGVDGEPYHGVDVRNTALFGQGLKLSDAFTLSLTDRRVRRLLPVVGRAAGSFDISFLTTEGWQEIPVYGTEAERDILTYWDVTGLHGEYPVRVVSRVGDQINLSIQSIYIGSLVDASASSATLTSPSGNASLVVPEGGLDRQPLSIDVVHLENLDDVGSLPSITPLGKVVKLSPGGLAFDDPKPQLHFTFNRSQLDRLGVSPTEVVIYNLTTEGSLEPLSTIKQLVKVNVDANGVVSSEDVLWDSRSMPPNEARDVDYTYLRAWSVLSHFSYYVAIEGMLLDRPNFEQSRIETSAETLGVGGTAEPNAELVLFVTDTPNGPGGAAPAASLFSDADGAFYFDGVQVSHEGENYFYVGYPDGVGTEFDKMVVTRDTTAPAVESSVSRTSISPNDDGNRDVGAVTAVSGEDGTIAMSVVRVVNSETVFLSEQPVSKDQVATFALTGHDIRGRRLPDGDYRVEVTASDALGNTGLGTNYSLKVDTAPPQISAVFSDRGISPKNLDEFYDSTSIDLEVNEQSTVSAWIGRVGDPSLVPLLESDEPTRGVALLWAGNDRFGHFVSDGFYYLFVEAEDPAGNVVFTRIEQEVRVDNTSPTVTTQLGIGGVHIIPEPLIYVYTTSEPGSAALELRLATLDDGGEASEALYQTTQLHDVRGEYTIEIPTEDLPDGEFVVSITTWDPFGNQSSPVERTVTLTRDVDPPEFVSLFHPVFEATDLMSHVTLSEPLVDDASPPIQLTSDAPDAFPLGVTTVRWTAIDRYGNTSSMTQNVTIEDTTAPVFEPIPAPVSVTTTAIDTSLPLEDVGADDIFPTIVTNDAPEVFAHGETVVTWRAEDSNGNVSTVEQAVNVSRPADDTVVEPWYHEDVGNVEIEGSVTLSNGQFSIEASGSDIWSTEDEFRFVYARMSGDGSFTARVSSIDETHQWAKAGLMVRSDRRPNSMHASIVLTPENRISFQWREDPGGVTAAFVRRWPTSHLDRIPTYLRLERQGNMFRAYVSWGRQFGRRVWLPIGTPVAVPMERDVYIGMAVTSHNGSVLNRAVFEDVYVDDIPAIPNTLPAGWRSTDIGDVRFDGASGVDDEGTFFVHGSGADIWGSDDEFQYAYRGLTGDGEIVARVRSQLDTDTWAKAGVMIRESLDSASPYAYSLVTPGNGTAFQWRSSQGERSDSQQPTTSSDDSWFSWWSAPPLLDRAPIYVKLRRDGDRFTAFTSKNGIHWTQIGESIQVSMERTVLVGLAVTGHNTRAIGQAEFDRVVVVDETTPPEQLPHGFLSGVIGSGGGGAEYANGLYEINAHHSDSEAGYQFVYRKIAGDATVVARVASFSYDHSDALAGVMMRSSLDSDGPHALTSLTPGRWGLLKLDTHGSGVSRSRFTLLPLYIKMVRTGDVVRSFSSFGGVIWTPVGPPRTVDMREEFYVGFVTSPGGNGQSSVTLSLLQATPGSQVSTPGVTIPIEW